MPRWRRGGRARQPAPHAKRAAEPPPPGPRGSGRPGAALSCGLGSLDQGLGKRSMVVSTIGCATSSSSTATVTNAATRPTLRTVATISLPHMSPPPSASRFIRSNVSSSVFFALATALRRRRCSSCCRAGAAAARAGAPLLLLPRLGDRRAARATAGRPLQASSCEDVATDRPVMQAVPLSMAAAPADCAEIDADLYTAEDEATCGFRLREV
ncbi:MAG: hypothetical protein J3K34DRAFT_409016 [Monoraphidium minutum]|nr:MAG: hypothetical protein J3K34DRAFT_409016 [Monoraphidium minutum]